MRKERQPGAKERWGERRGKGDHVFSSNRARLGWLWVTFVPVSSGARIGAGIKSEAEECVNLEAVGSHGGTQSRGNAAAR